MAPTSIHAVAVSNGVADREDITAGTWTTRRPIRSLGKRARYPKADLTTRFDKVVVLWQRIDQLTAIGAAALARKARRWGSCVVCQRVGCCE